MRQRARANRLGGIKSVLVIAAHKTVLPFLGAFALSFTAAPLHARQAAPAAAPQAPASAQTAPPVPASGAQPSAEGVLGQLTATGSAKFSSAQIIAASGLKSGAKVNREDLQLAANRLSMTGLFSNVRYRYASIGPKVNVQFQVQDAKTLHVSFDNFPWFTDAQLSADIRKAVGLFDGTSPESGSYVDAIGAAIQSQLQTLGVQGRVEHRLIERPVGTGLEVQFRLVGVTLNVGSVEFTDRLAEHDERVAERLQDLIGKPFSRYYTDVFVAEQVRPIYLSQGYLQVRFGSPEARFSGNPNQPNLNQVVVVVPVHPGKQYTWGGANWSGNTVFTSAALSKMVGLDSGQVADGLAIEAAWQKIRQAYGAKGYLDAALDAQPSFNAANGTVSYAVKVNEGQPYRMGKLVISGLSVEGEKRVRNAWLIHPGQTFDLDYYHAFLGSIAKKALADLPVHYQHIGRYLQRHKDGTVDVLLDFQ
jgi:hypothetical protein